MEVSKIFFFIIGLILFLLGIIMSLRRKSNKNVLYYSALIEFASHFVLLLPFEYSETPSSLFRAIEGFFETLLVSLTKYSGEGYDRFLVDSSDPSVAMFNSCYNILLTLTNIMMLVFAANIVLHLIEGPYQELKLFFYRKRKIYLFSECNDKTLAIAESLNYKKSEKFAIVFASSDDEVSDVDKEAIRKINAIFMNVNVVDVFSHLNGRSANIEIFLFNEKEEKNLQQMSDIASEMATKSVVRLFVEVNETPWSLYDDFIEKVTSDNPPLTINLVRTEENFIYNLLLDESIFEDSTEVNGVKKIRILIVGYSDRSIEFLKAILHLGQMPGYELSIVMLEDDDHKGVVLQKIPELYKNGAGFGDAIYSFKHIPNIRFDSSDLDECVDIYKDFTYAFVDVEGDINCLNAAMQMNIIRNRNIHNCKYKIIACINNRALCNEKRLNKYLIRNISIVGDVHDIYNYEFITMSRIEKATIAIHKNRYKDKKTWKEYCNKEYNRHSVYARTLSFAYKVKIIDEMYDGSDRYERTNSDMQWKIYEHMRWNMYTRTLGYINAPSNYPRNADGSIDSNMRKALKIHECLIPFDDLPPEEKRKDSLELNEEIVNSLKSCFK